MNLVKKISPTKCTLLTEGNRQGEWLYSAEDKMIYKDEVISPAIEKDFITAKHKKTHLKIDSFLKIETLTEDRAKTISNALKSASIGTVVGMLTTGAGVGLAAGAALGMQKTIYLVEAELINGEILHFEMTTDVYEPSLIASRLNKQKSIDETQQAFIEQYYGGDYDEDAHKAHRKKIRDGWILIAGFTTLFIYAVLTGDNN